MKNLNVGARKLLAIDFQLLQAQPAPFGLLRFWIGGQPLGTADEPTFLYPILLSLEGALKKRRDPLTDQLTGLDAKVAWAVLNEQGEQYLLPSIDVFDDLIIYAVPSEQHVRLFWKMLDGHALHDMLLPREALQKTVSQLREYIDGLAT